MALKRTVVRVEVGLMDAGVAMGVSGTAGDRWVASTCIRCARNDELEPLRPSPSVSPNLGTFLGSSSCPFRSSELSSVAASSPLLSSFFDLFPNVNPR